MKHLLSDSPAIRLVDAARRMREEIPVVVGRFLADPPQEDNPTTLRISVQINPVDSLGWLSRQVISPQVFWSQRDNAWQVAGIGAADQFTMKRPVPTGPLFLRLHNALVAAPESLRYYGGLEFDYSVDPVSDPVWSGFPAGWFVLPRFEVVTYGDRAVFACNIRDDETDEKSMSRILAALEEITFDDSLPDTPRPNVLSKLSVPQESEWKEQVQQTLSAINSGRFRKAVLGRCVSAEFDAPLSPWKILRDLPGALGLSYRFGFRYRSGATFIGASPERLYSRKRQAMETEALAGTRTRGETPDTDRKLARDLLASEKERTEHRIVAESIERALTALKASTKISDISVRKLSTTQHLQAGILAKLPNPDSDEQVLTALHPTPAVGGSPRDEALAHTRSLEPFARGWYAGPVGWVESAAAEFAVGIRSALVKDKTIHVFAGAGIIEGSDPNSEWEELDAKAALMLTAAGVPL